ncbi:geranylgeranyl diphosphate synthase type I [Saccharopolyspora lacisalsi]|uniref:Geranylgeranyl diphosphate synthase type I n=2 Tax=Halosaccharopolyspora lacisalsi TaxID=1000566 RepID=A0A839DNK7_9PSEU|nr:geranylgeranyl diphosphate synthase type I [Halosaccharopolyspora lacisalsi]
MVLTQYSSDMVLPGMEEVRERVDVRMRDFVDRQRTCSAALLPERGDRFSWSVAMDDLHRFVGRGKRLRAAFCYWGWRGAGGDPDDEGIITVAAAVELLHAFALIHDDLMDDSDTRRGEDSLHRRHASLHSSSGAGGSSEHFGKSVALLLGNLCLGWFHELLAETTAPPERVRAVRSVVSQEFLELVFGQYLDLVEQTGFPGSVERSRRVIHYKTAKYTIERPLHLGGALAGASPGLLDSYTAYAEPLGEAFQLRDDVLGAFGDPASTGKPVEDDLTTRKATVLMATARRRATAAQAVRMERVFDKPHLDAEDVQTLRTLLVDTGALAEIEGVIEERAAVAATELSTLPADARTRHVLDELIHSVTHRRQ